MPDDDRMVNNVRGTQNRPAQAIMPSDETIYADDHLEGYTFFNSSETEEKVVFWNFAISDDELKHEHITFIHNNERFNRLIERSISSQRLFVILGRASASGDESENQNLSRQRALSFGREFFRHSQFLADPNGRRFLARLHGFGSSQEIVSPSSSTPGQRAALNRSVEIAWIDRYRCANALPMDQVLQDARLYLNTNTGISMDAATFDNLWTPTGALMEKIAPKSMIDFIPLNHFTSQPRPLRGRRAFEFITSVGITHIHLVDSLMRRAPCNIQEVHDGVERWWALATHARSTKIRMDQEIARYIRRIEGSGGGSGFVIIMRSYEDFLQRVMFNNRSCVFHYLPW